MKKITTIIITICHFILLTGNAQETKTGSVKKRQQYCSAEITMMDNSVEKFALGGFVGDSIVVFSLAIENKHLQILPDQENKISANRIKKVKINVEIIKKSPEIFTKTLGFKQQANTISVSNIQGTHAIDGVGKSLAFAASEPVTLLVGLILLPIIIPVAILTAKEKTYHINGRAKRLERMEKKLTKK
jgi:hypothetical protein